MNFGGGGGHKHSDDSMILLSNGKITMVLWSLKITSKASKYLSVGDQCIWK
jgi:hypothetical protein